MHAVDHLTSGATGGPAGEGARSSPAVVPGTDHLDPAAWNPLIYNFRHYFGLGHELGHSFRSETPTA